MAKTVKVWDFTPRIGRTSPYVAPPPPQPLKKPVQHTAAAAAALSAELRDLSDHLRTEADALDNAVVQDKKRRSGLDIQLGLMLTKQDEESAKAGSALKNLLGPSQWNVSDKGLTKAEFRLKLRTCNLEASSADCDTLFDSLDHDKGGSLDLSELRSSLDIIQRNAERWRDRPAPGNQKALQLRKHADMADGASRATEVAELAEQALADMTERHMADAGIQLGLVLFKRGVKPGAVVHTWSTSRGEHAGELSKKDFREAVQALGLSHLSGDGIDAVFDTFDEDLGGFLDVFEAKGMIKQLRKSAEEAEHEVMKITLEAHRARKVATRKSTLARQPVADEVLEAESPPMTKPKVLLKPKAVRASSDAPIVGSFNRAAPKPSPRISIPAPTLSAVIASAGPAMSAAISLLSSRVTRRPEPMNDAMLACAAQMTRLELTRSWRTWQASCRERTQKLLLARSVVLRHLLPRLMSRFGLWQDFCKDKKRQRLLMHTAAVWHNDYISAGAFMHWCRQFSGMPTQQLVALQRPNAEVCGAFSNLFRRLVQCAYFDVPCAGVVAGLPRMAQDNLRRSPSPQQEILPQQVIM
jgi:hypothetical protein